MVVLTLGNCYLNTFHLLSGRVRKGLIIAVLSHDMALAIEPRPMPEILNVARVVVDLVGKVRYFSRDNEIEEAGKQQDKAENMARRAPSFHALCLHLFFYICNETTLRIPWGKHCHGKHDAD